MLWNQARAPAHGPRLPTGDPARARPGGCDTCRGVVTIDPAAATVTRDGAYDVLGHRSRFVLRGARRTASTHGPGHLGTAAFLHPDGTQFRIARDAGTMTVRIRVVDRAQGFGYALPAGAVATFVWREAGRGG